MVTGVIASPDPQVWRLLLPLLSPLDEGPPQTASPSRPLSPPLPVWLL